MPSPWQLVADDAEMAGDGTYSTPSGCLTVLAYKTWALCCLLAALRGSPRSSYDSSQALVLPSGALRELKVVQLKQRLRQLGLPVSGRKHELIERLQGRSHLVRSSGGMSFQRRAVVRDTFRAGQWTLDLRDDYVRPPKSLQGSLSNPLCVLGECGDENCALYRFRPGNEPVRDDLVSYSAEKVLEHVKNSPKGLVYCSLGCGSLYFDWELLDRLVNVERVAIEQVWLVDPVFHPNSTENSHARLALAAFARWFSDCKFQVQCFQNTRALHRWAFAFQMHAKADIVIQCDAVETLDLLDDDPESDNEDSGRLGRGCKFRSAVCSEEALNLQMYSQLLGRRKPGPGRRRDPVPVAPVRRVRRRSGAEDYFHLVETQSWKDGGWSEGDASLSLASSSWEAAEDDMQEDFTKELQRRLEEDYR
eukprot:TRINITY_DN47116_c0_g1_i1.p1 TRINITY_DN47116_c0_g1~~TRINITY_DN47116_c0_g1_i1.p1  ORF type:complete len:420 (-),score=66.63 TRINITY_DN47116_c0_g1_i1:284-1543(-)